MSIDKDLEAAKRLPATLDADWHYTNHWEVQDLCPGEDGFLWLVVPQDPQPPDWRNAEWNRLGQALDAACAAPRLAAEVERLQGELQQAEAQVNTITENALRILSGRRCTIHVAPSFEEFEAVLGCPLCAAAEVERLRQEYQRLLTILEECVQQGCVLDDGSLHSKAISTYRDALQFLAEIGRVEITKQHGRWVEARWVPREGAAEVGSALVEFIRAQREWSEATFGPGARTRGICAHIRKELQEIEAAPGDLGEWCDVVILALDGAWRAGYTPEQIAAALREKQAENAARRWGPPAGEDAPNEHIREGTEP